jgi:crossover junction endodeoxyribonuclease RusA
MREREDVLFHGELDFVIPPKSNRYFHTGRKYVFIPQRIREAVEDATLILRSMYNGEPINKPVAVEIVYAFKDSRKRDLDNLTKTLLDVLEDAGILDDDKFVYKLSIEKKIKQKDEKTEIRIFYYNG